MRKVIRRNFEVVAQPHPPSPVFYPEPEYTSPYGEAQDEHELQIEEAEEEARHE